MRTIQTLSVEQAEPVLLVQMLGENGDGTGSPLFVVENLDDKNIFENPIYQTEGEDKPNEKEQPTGTTLGDVLVGIGNVLNGSTTLPVIKTPEQLAAEKEALEQAAKRKRFAFIAVTVLAITILAFVAFNKNK